MQIRAALFAALMLTAPAAAQNDPKVDFLGHCIAQGSSSSYCACMADKLSAVLPGNDYVVYNDYLGLIAQGQKDTDTLIAQLTEKHGISKKDLARILTAANAVVGDPATCAGL